MTTDPGKPSPVLLRCDRCGHVVVLYVAGSAVCLPCARAMAPVRAPDAR